MPSFLEMASCLSGVREKGVKSNVGGKLFSFGIACSMSCYLLVSLWDLYYLVFGFYFVFPGRLINLTCCAEVSLFPFLFPGSSEGIF